MILLLGGSGYVGTAFRQLLDTKSISYRSVARADVDYTQRDSLIHLIRETNPSFLINAAGYSGKPNVDACELHRSDCLFGNAVLPGVIREACEQTNLRWGHVSSGCIFTGAKPDGSGFTESDRPNFSFRTNNCSFYSGCKALGEEVLEGAENCYIWRLRIPFNNVDSPRNYISKLMNYDCLLSARNSLSELSDFVAACLHCAQNDVAPGIYNLTNPGDVTTEDVVEMISRHGLSNKKFRFFASEDEFMQVAAKTPRSNCVLDSSKAVAAGIQLPDVHDALEAAMKNWES